MNHSTFGISQAAINLAKILDDDSFKDQHKKYRAKITSYLCDKRHVLNFIKSISDDRMRKYFLKVFREHLVEAPLELPKVIKTHMYNILISDIRNCMHEKKTDPHNCEGNLPYGSSYGEAIEYCSEVDGEFWVGNGEYSSQVAFCPYCGAKAPRQPEIK